MLVRLARRQLFHVPLISTTGKPSPAIFVLRSLYLYEVHQEDLVMRKAFKHCSWKLTTHC